MNTRTETRSAGRRIAVALGTLIAAGALAAGLSGCQTNAQALDTRIAGPEPRPAAAAPEGIDTTLPADRIVEAIERQRQQQAERFDGVPADRVEDALRQETVAAARADCAVRLVATGYAGSAAQAASLCVTGAPLPSTR